MNTSGSARTPRRIGWWRILAGIWTAMTLAGVMLIVAPLVVPPSHGTAQRAHFTPASLPTFPTNGTPQSNRGAQVPVPLWITAPKANIAGLVIPVGADAQGAMEAPEGANNDPVWSEAFWWRGGVMPGQVGNAVMGGTWTAKMAHPRSSGTCTSWQRATRSGYEPRRRPRCSLWSRQYTPLRTRLAGSRIRCCGASLVPPRPPT